MRVTNKYDTNQKQQVKNPNWYCTVLISIHKTSIALKELTFPEVKFLRTALLERMPQIIQHVCKEGLFSNQP